MAFRIAQALNVPLDDAFQYPILAEDQEVSRSPKTGRVVDEIRKLRGRPDTERLVGEIDKLRGRPDTERLVGEINKLRDQ